ncbi:MAG: MgtC/SapB family protein [Lysobacterales bacterium]|nr:MAG: MgtC/SapB family protein [Xanthomonadales bacterium]
MDYFDPFGRAFWTVIGVAILCGGIVGLERQFRGKPAGVRTSILVCLGTAVFIHLGTALSGDATDPTRVLGQLVTGIGFLGAGVMFSRRGIVTGVTTAAVIWVLAAIGAAIGLGRYVGALALAVVIVAVLVGVEVLESSVKRLTRGVHEREED